MNQTAKKQTAKKQTAKKQTAKKQAAKKQTAKKQTAKKQTARKQTARKSRKQTARKQSVRYEAAQANPAESTPHAAPAEAAINPLACAYARLYPDEVAASLSKRGADALYGTLDSLPADVAANVIARLPHGHAVRYLSGFDGTRIAAWIDAADLGHALSILLHVGLDRRQRILEGLASRSKRRILSRLVVYPPGTAGATLNPVAPRLEVSMSLADAVELLRGDNLQPEQAIWLVDGDGNYQGLLDSARALTARTDHAGLDEFMLKVRPLRAETTLSNAHHSDQWLQQAELPVIDEQGHLLGSIARARLQAELGSADMAASGLIDAISDLAYQYLRVLGICLGDLFDRSRSRR